MSDADGPDVPTYETQPPGEVARILRDRLTGVEARHLGLTADRMAGNQVDEAKVAELEQRIAALKGAAEQAEQAEAGGGETGRASAPPAS